MKRYSQTYTSAIVLNDELQTEQQVRAYVRPTKTVYLDPFDHLKNYHVSNYGRCLVLKDL